MRMWDHQPVPRHRRNDPSFSSSLLDAIYRSMDAESDSSGNLTGIAPDPAAKISFAVPVRESPLTPLNYRSSSDDADSVRTARPRTKPARLGLILSRPDRFRSDPLPPNPNPTKDPIPIKGKLRDIKKSTSPSSPRSRLAGFLNSLFAPSNHKKTKISTAESPSPSPSSASSCSRSCLSKTPSTHRSTGSTVSKRSVRFSPTGVIVGEDCRPCGEKFLFDGEAATEAEERRRRWRVVEELMKGFEMEAESGDESDEGSEDLFELENLAGINGGGGGGGGGFRDELPVYGTTDLRMNRAIAKGLAVGNSKCAPQFTVRPHPKVK